MSAEGPLQLGENSPDGLIAYAVLMSIIVFSYLVAVFATGGWKFGGKSPSGKKDGGGTLPESTEKRADTSA